MVYAQQAQDRRVDIVGIKAHFGGLDAEFVSRAEDLAAFHAAAGHPHTETVGVVVAAVIALGEGRAAEFAAPDYEGGIEQAAAFEVAQQAGDGLVGSGGHTGVGAG